MLKGKKVLEILYQKKLTLSVAESCTGGLLCNRLTDIPGSSKVFLLGIIAYSNTSKNKILKIPIKIIRAKGAVSAETAKRMAIGIRRISGASAGIGITGIAGPGGASKFKPAGTVFIAVSFGKNTLVKEFHFAVNRLGVKRKAADKAIELLLKTIR